MGARRVELLRPIEAAWCQLLAIWVAIWVAVMMRKCCAVMLDRTSRQQASLRSSSTQDQRTTLDKLLIQQWLLAMCEGRQHQQRSSWSRRVDAEML